MMTSSGFPARGDVFDVALDPVMGSELGKTRPAVIVSNDRGNRASRTVAILPITSAVPRRSYRFEVTLPEGTAGLTRTSRAKADQIRTVDKQRLLRYRGHLSPDLLLAVEDALRTQLDLGNVRASD